MGEPLRGGNKTVKALLRLPIGTLGKHSLAAFLLRGGGLALGFLVQILLARSAGAEEYGLYQLCFGWLFLFSIPAIGGFDVLITKFAPRYQNEERHLLSHLLHYASRTSFIRSLFLAIAVTVAFFFFGERTYLFPVSITAMILLLRSQSEIHHALLRGLQKTALGLVPDLIVRPVLFGMICGAFVIFAHLQAVEALGAFALAQLAALVVVFTLSRREIVSRDEESPSEEIHGEWRDTAFFLMLLAGTYLLMAEVDKVMLGFFVPLDEIGYYSGAARLATLAYFTPNAIAAIGGPMISQVFYTEREALQSLLRRIALITIILSLPIVIPLLLFPNVLLSIFGAEFTVAALPLIILTSGFLADIALGPSGYLLSMTESHRAGLALLSIGVAVNITLNLFLIPNFGIVGAATATALSTALRSLLTCLYSYRTYKVNTSWGSICCRSTGC
jgi:O-antigen/teichoic acid export membrane protein